eukprot:1309061-Amorphochlora_amoeboformis.AAC.1
MEILQNSTPPPPRSNLSILAIHLPPFVHPPPLPGTGTVAPSAPASRHLCPRLSNGRFFSL